ncbi:hypothetical protein OBBRIDRAFT_797291 [Obba rivulosa]|uniref:Secreted protein n=1 Tax=Obba rivulosa TaxID=1052685 RepID=A0A8E2DFT7_9APHY|nr:hypothetical protein OBBRIDRAFT_797291 [Obba rivulosa]
MRIVRCLSFLLAAVPATVLACEGECIVGITDAFLGNYTKPLGAVLGSVANRISDMIPNHPGTDTVLSYLAPFMHAYENQSYAGMETAIFPNYFHGKCQQNGVDPPGCPNPDCPVVCGTPGSLVHFYSTLRYIAFNQTRHILNEFMSPSSDIYRQVEQNIMDAANSQSRRTTRIHPRQLLQGLGSPSAASMSSPLNAAGSLTGPASGPLPGGPLPGDPLSAVSAVTSPSGSSTNTSSSSKMIIPLFMKRANTDDMKTQLQAILRQMPNLLLDECGGSSDGKTNSLPNCSWEQDMKAYILSFP